MRICKDCKNEKDLTEFHKQGKWYRWRCKKCHNLKYQPPTGKPNVGRFKKGHISVPGLNVGRIPWNKGKAASEEMKKMLLANVKGRKHSPEEIEKRRQSLIKIWENKAGRKRHSSILRRFSREIRERDNFTCKECLATDKKLHVHHIVPWDNEKDLRFDESNAITLCISCHMKLHSAERLATGWTPWPKGKKMSKEHRKKMSESHKGQKAWNKGKRMNVTVV